MGDNANNLYTSSGNPAAGSAGRSAPLRSEYDLIETGFSKIKVLSIAYTMLDANTAGTVYFGGMAPAGTLTTLNAVAIAANATTNTIFTSVKIDNSAVTYPTWQILSTDVAYAKSSVAPTAANTFGADGTIEITSDGGGSTVMPVVFSAEITLS